MGYEKVTEAIQEHGLSWNEIDRILLNEEAYEEFHETGAESSNYATTDTPAVRHTTGQEKIVYIDNKGYLNEIKL
jgi:hypothetical protein